MSHEILRQDLAELAAEHPAAARLGPGDATALAASFGFAPAELPAGAWEELESKLAAEDEVPEGEAPRVSLSCTYCHDGLSTSGAQAVAYCASCLAPHHLDCFEDHARCSAPGCAETRWVQPQASGQAPAPATPAKGKPDLRVLPSESDRRHSPPHAPPQRRRVTTIAGILAASLLGVSAAALSLFDVTPDATVGTSSERETVLVFARTLPAGTLLTSDDVGFKEVYRSKVKVLAESQSPVITTSNLSAIRGLRLDRRVLAGELIRVRQFRAAEHLPEGATFETCVFTHDVQPGEVLSADDFERRKVAWKTLWEAPDQSLVHDSQVQAYVGRRLTAIGRGGEPIRYAHFEGHETLPEASPKPSWTPTPAEQEMSLSEQGRNLLRLAKPVERARAYLRHHGLAKQVDLERGVKVARYCPPQPTHYSWLVTFEDTFGMPIYVAVSEAGRTWQLDEKFGVMRQEEFSLGGFLPR